MSTRKPDAAERRAAREAAEREAIDRKVRETVAAAPPLTDAQAETIARLLRPYAEPATSDDDETEGGGAGA